VPVGAVIYCVQRFPFAVGIEVTELATGRADDCQSLQLLYLQVVVT
jgi:hypothetical protein